MDEVAAIRETMNDAVTRMGEQRVKIARLTDLLSRIVAEVDQGSTLTRSSLMASVRKELALPVPQTQGGAMKEAEGASLPPLDGGNEGTQQ